MEKINLIKFIANSGFCSRKEAEDLVKEGKVLVDSKIAQDPGLDVSEKQEIQINNKILTKIKKVRLFAFHKPKKCIVSRIDPEGRITIYDLIEKNYKKICNERLIYVGRLDFNSEGLILLTNYGPLARFFELPKNKIKRIYELKIFGKWNDEIIKILQNGVKIDGIQYEPIKTKILKQNNKQIWIECELFEGKNNELRKIFKHFGFLVPHLKRIQYENFCLSGLSNGELQEIQGIVVRRILEKAEIVF